LTSYRPHYVPESGNSYKIALILTLSGQTFEPIWTDYARGVTRTAEWRSTVNEMGEIPVLEENGQGFTQTAPTGRSGGGDRGGAGGERRGHSGEGAQRIVRPPPAFTVLSGANRLADEPISSVSHSPFRE
jgi:glutathione S-transferase